MSTDDSSSLIHELKLRLTELEIQNEELRLEAADLREHERINQSLIAGLPDIVMRFDREGRHLFVPDNVRDVVDITPAQFLGKTHRELGFAEEHCSFWEKSVQRVFDSGESFETEFKIEGEKGELIFNWRLLPELDSENVLRSVISISRDITAHRKAKENYEMLFREMLDGFALHEIICDTQGNPVDYRFLAVNPAFERLTGLKAENVIGRTVKEVLPGTELHWIDSYGNVALTGEPMFFESYSDELNKHYEVKAFRPATNQFACIFADITERTMTQESLEKTEAVLRAALDTCPAGIAIAEAPGGALQYVNDAGLLILGQDRKSIMSRVGINQYAAGLAFLDLEGRPLHPDEEPLSRAILFGENCSREFMIRRAEDDERIVLANASPIRDVNGNVTSGIIVFMDITERKRAEEEIQLKNAELERFTYTVSHDLKSPLITIKGFAGAMESDLRSGRYERLTGDLKRIKSAADMMDSLLSNLLELAAIGRVINTPEAVDMNLLVDEAITNLAGALKLSKMNIEVQPDLPTVFCDRVRLAEVIQNLLENAIKYMGGQAVPRILVGTRRDEEDIILFVQDTGMGIEKKYQQSIFGLFNKLDSRSEGAGIGLAIVKRIIEVHHGRVWVESEGLGMGSRFCFTVNKKNKEH